MRARTLMVQGTMSGVGKSLLVAGLARVLAQDGVRVAPFKSQNMALNSAITRDGLEIGRAQAMQALAAGIEPTDAMNPILLKPTTDRGSQVAIRGKAHQTMEARAYFAYRGTLRGTIQAAFDELASEFEVVLIEGAGSPVELNLRRDDIVNMGLAELVDAPVALVGDIDHGGIFAQLFGTMELLEPHERRRVRTTVVNKFRGDLSLFADGVDMLAELTGVPVAGVLPYLDVALDDEDSLSERLGRRTRTEALDVAVIRLPKISNFTDFIALEEAQGIGVRYVRTPSELGSCDLVVLPGTKATLSDLAWLEDGGLAQAIRTLAADGTPVLGICGGYQMLGHLIDDSAGVEGPPSRREGLGLLPVCTTFSKEKRTTRVHGSLLEVEGPLAPLTGLAVTGYEIHQGRSTRTGGAPLLTLATEDGKAREDGCQEANVYGCYLHGIFDQPHVVEALARGILGCEGAHESPIDACDMSRRRQESLDRLADAVRAHLDMNLIQRIIEEGV